jgi:ABC-type branched-subunit amino acid transport system permease subunit
VSGAPHDRAVSVGLHAAIGAWIGAAVGGVAAYAVTHRSNAAEYTDHSEDAFVYWVFIPAGAVTGAVVGALVGLYRTRKPPARSALAPARHRDQ